MCDGAHSRYATIIGNGRPSDRARLLIPSSGAGWDPYARRLDHALRGARTPLPGVPGPHRVPPAPRAALPPEAALRAVRAGTAGLGRRPPPQPRLPRAPHLASRARLRAAAARAGGADLLPAAGPHEAPLGAMAGRGAEGRTL